MILKTSLYPWQQKAVEKLLPLRVGALFMEMGSGKSRVVLEMIKQRLDSGKAKHFLWLCPCSVKDALKDEIQKHCEGALIAVYGIESLSSSSRLYDKLMKFVQAADTMLIVDESNLVKNITAIRTKRIIELSQYCKYRIILNGTPISRCEADLFAQWYILDWRILGYRSFWSFAANHLEYDDHHQVRRVLDVEGLTDKIAPYSYTVRKSDILRLPDKSYDRRAFSLTEAQMKHYRTMRDEFLMTLFDLQDDAAIYRTFTALQEITSGRRIISDVKEAIRHKPFFSSPWENPKIQLLLNILEKRKTIIWCKFQHEVDDIYTVLSKEYGRVQTFTGKMSQKSRTAALRHFRDDDLFLVANKTCAGYGLNLQFCDCAIYYSNDWNWATRIQSEDRIHRIGQEHEVRITDIYALDTIDTRILRCLDKKEKLSESFKYAVKNKNALEVKLDETAGVSE